MRVRDPANRSDAGGGEGEKEKKLLAVGPTGRGSLERRIGRIERLGARNHRVWIILPEENLKAAAGWFHRLS